jgi:hypothetical protein
MDANVAEVTAEARLQVRSNNWRQWRAVRKCRYFRISDLRRKVAGSRARRVRPADHTLADRWSPDRVRCFEDDVRGPHASAASVMTDRAGDIGRSMVAGAS